MRGLLTLLLILMLLAGGAGWIGMQSYMSAFTALDSEAPIAKIAITQAQNGAQSGTPRHQRYYLVVQYANGTEGTYKIAGDYFMLEGEVVTLKGWAAALGGGTARARLTRLEGRYNQIFESAPQLCFKDGDKESTKFWDGSEPCISQYNLENQQYKTQFKGREDLIGKFGERILNLSKSARTRLPFRSGAGSDLVGASNLLICMTEDALVVRRPDEGCKGATTQPVAASGQ